MFEIYYFDWLLIAPCFDYLQMDSEAIPFKNKHYLYRAFNSIDELIYTGESSRPLERMLEHQAKSSWFPEAFKILIYGCRSKKEAVALEEVSIEFERPTYNRAGRKDLPKATRASSSTLVDKKGSPWAKKCLHCESILDPTWARSNRKYCDDTCRSSYKYQTRHKDNYASRYQKKKRQWEQSDSGKKAGVPIREWLRLPLGWR